jgi:hypothetical protein
MVIEKLLGRETRYMRQNRTSLYQIWVTASVIIIDNIISSIASSYVRHRQLTKFFD